MKIRQFSLTSLAFASAVAFLASAAGAYADDIPLPPGNFRASDGGDRYVFTWSKVGKTGVTGGAVDQNSVSYILEELNENYESQRILASGNIQTYTFFYPTTNGEQDLKRFSIYARNSAGSSDKAYTKVVTGKPYNLPFKESFATSASHGLLWQDGDGAFNVTSELTFDEDGGSIACIPASDGSASSFNLGKIMMAYSANPRLSFSLIGLEEGEKLNVRVMRPDGQEATVKTVTGPVDEWTIFVVELDAVKNQKFIIPKFQMAAGNKGMIVIDDINIYDPYDNDIAIMVRPLDNREGSTTVRVTVDNMGLTVCTGATVALYADGEFVTRHEISGDINPGDRYTFDAPVSVKAKQEVEIKAVAEWAFDLNPYNDVATTRMLGVEAPQISTAGVSSPTTGLNFSTARIFTVDGREVRANSMEELQPGIYIMDGKKFIVR